MRKSSNLFVEIGIVIAIILAIMVIFTTPAKAGGNYDCTGFNITVSNVVKPSIHHGTTVVVTTDVETKRIENVEEEAGQVTTAYVAGTEIISIEVFPGPDGSHSIKIDKDVKVECHEPTPTPSPSPTPQEEICGNGIDDDGDGQIDEDCHEETEEPTQQPTIVKTPDAPTITDTYPTVSCYITGLDAALAALMPSEVDGHVVRIWEYAGVWQGIVGPFKHGDWMQQGETREYQIHPNVKFMANWNVVNGSPVYNCWFSGALPEETPDPTSPVVTLYADCDKKIISQRLNSNTVEEWDVSDIIAIKGFENMPSEWQFTNVTTNWGDSLENQPALSWDGCWFVTERVVEGESSLWWSPFGDPVQIKVAGQPIDGVEAATGKNGEIVYRDRQTNELMLTDRAGSGPRHLGIFNGFEPEVSQDGNWVIYRKSDGSLMQVSIYGVTAGQESLDTQGILPEVHPERQVLFARQSLGITNVIAHETDDEMFLYGTALMTVIPDSERAVAISTGDLQFSLDWENEDFVLVADPFVSNELAVWVHPDATRISNGTTTRNSSTSTSTIDQLAEGMYIVKSGDTLSSICASNGAKTIYGDDGCVVQLMQANGLTAADIHEGDILEISGIVTEALEAEEPVNVHVVKSGETLSDICASYNAQTLYGEDGCISELMRVNSLTSTTIFEGDLLAVAFLVNN